MKSPPAQVEDMKKTTQDAMKSPAGAGLTGAG